MEESKVLKGISPDCRSYKILCELDKQGKITVLPREVVAEIERNLEKAFIEIKKEYMAREQRSAKMHPRVIIRRRNDYE